MAEPLFFSPGPPIRLAEIAATVGVEPPEGVPDLTVTGVASLEDAGPGELSYMDSQRYAAALRGTRAGICLVSARFAHWVPDGTVGLVTRDPYRGFAAVLQRLYPDALRPGSLFGTAGISPGSCIHPTARLEDGITVDPGAVIGPGAEIGRGSVIGAGAVIGPQVRIGRDCSIGPHASVQHALLGNRVVLFPGARVGQDGFGYAMGRSGHSKVPQIGRVILQDDVEIGANSTVDRGTTRDTIIGEGTKIDNLVQVGHNVVIGRHCIIVSHVGISGSSTLGDYVVMAGKSSTVGHVRVGDGAQIAGASNVTVDVPPGERWGGMIAKPTRDWFREVTTLKRLASRRVVANDGDRDDER